MYEKFVLGRIETEQNIVNDLWESVLSGEKNLKEAVISSSLSDFTKNFIINDLQENDDKDELRSRVERSNKLYFNYAIRPKWTMITYLFGTFESRPPADIIRKLNTFPFYNYYVESVKNFIKENSSIFVTKTEIGNVLDLTNKAVHEKLVTDISNIKIKNFLLQIFRLKYDEESYNLESSVPYSFIKIFLLDKSFGDLEKKFSTVKGINDEYEISLKDIIKVLTDKYLLQETHADPLKKPEPVKPENKLETEKKPEPVKVDVEKKMVTEKKVTQIIPEKKKVNPEVKPKAGDEPKEKPAEILPGKKLQTGIYSAQLEKADKEEKNHSKTDEIITYDIKDLFNEKQLNKISEKVYGSDLVKREKSFDKLNHYRTWLEASDHLKEIFRNNEVDLYNKDVIAFIDILNDYYQTKR